jgi:hypothetical protein
MRERETGPRGHVVLLSLKAGLAGAADNDGDGYMS